MHNHNNFRILFLEIALSSERSFSTAPPDDTIDNLDGKGGRDHPPTHTNQRQMTSSPFYYYIRRGGGILLDDMYHLAFAGDETIVRCGDIKNG